MQIWLLDVKAGERKTQTSAPSIEFDLLLHKNTC